MPQLELSVHKVRNVSVVRFLRTRKKKVQLVRSARKRLHGGDMCVDVIKAKRNFLTEKVRL